MSCCTVAGTSKYFSRSAGYYARKFRRRGLDAPQRILVKALRSLGLHAKTVLEIGCGVGGLHLTLLREGAASAFGVEVSDGMIEKAQELASEMGFTSRVAYRVGDFAETNGSVPRSDIVVMDKVLCCYADPGALTRKSAAKCGEVFAVSYPRNAILPRLWFTFTAQIGKILRWSFHPLYHEPADLDAAILAEGFREVYSGTTVVWQVKVFAWREQSQARKQNL